MLERTLVRKNSKSIYRTTIDLCTVKATVKAEHGPMPLSKSELSDLIGSKYFCSLPFHSSRWQWTNEPESYESCAINVPQSTFLSIRVLQGLESVSSYFQFTILPLFDCMTDAMKESIDNFILHTKTESRLADYQKECFNIRNK